MSFNLGGFLSGVSGLLGSSQLPAVSSIGNIAGIASSFIQPTGVPMGGNTSGQAIPVAASGRALVGLGAAVGRRFFEKFPNLATAIQMYRNQGKNITRGKLFALVRRFGPEFVITGGILTAAAVNELMIAGPGTRRMNPGNVKALRKSLRRLESFHHLCARVDKLRRPRSRKTGRSSGSTTHFVRQG